MTTLLLVALVAAAAVLFWGLRRALCRRSRGVPESSQERQFVIEGFIERSAVRTFDMPMGLPPMHLTRIFFTDGRQCLINGCLDPDIGPGTLIHVWRQGFYDFFVEAIDLDGFPKL